MMATTPKMSTVLYEMIVKPNEEHFIKRIPYIIKYIEHFIAVRSEALSARGPSRRVHFTEGDRQEFFRAVDIKEEVVQAAVRACPLIDNKWFTLVDTFNILCVSLIFCYFQNRKKLARVKSSPHHLMTFLLTLKFYSSLQFRQFPFNPDETIMIATIEELSEKFLIKKFNTIFEMNLFIANSNVENMEMELITPNDKNMTYYITNLNTRVSSAMKNITNEFLKHHEENKKKEIARLQSEDEEGDTYLNVMRNISSDIEVASRKIRLKMASSGRIDETLLTIASNKMHISSDKMHIMLSKILEDKTSNDTMELISTIIAYYLTMSRNDISSIKSTGFVETMRSAYGVSNTKNEYIIKIKEKLDFLIEKYSSSYTKTMKRATLSNARGCIFLYIVLFISRNIE